MDQLLVCISALEHMHSFYCESSVIQTSLIRGVYCILKNDVQFAESLGDSLRAGAFAVP